MDSGIFYNGGRDLLHTLVLGVTAYFSTLVLLRLTGKRTLTKLNVFDFIFVVALGSIVADTILTPGTTLARGMVAMGVLIGLQLLISFVASRVRPLESLINGTPEALFVRGEFLPDKMKHHRMSRCEILAAIRGAGVARLGEVEAVVLETDGSLSIVRTPDRGAPTTLGDVDGYEADEARRPPLEHPSREVAAVPR
jgi:uncharacterized membrane protein YcaP (DUF421 family)